VATPWGGVSKTEKELVDCCESLEDDYFGDSETEEDGDDDETDTGDPASSSSLLATSSSLLSSVGGVLAVEKGTSEKRHVSFWFPRRRTLFGALLSHRIAGSCHDPSFFFVETRFAAVLSRGCHTMAARSLALAILERTLEAYLSEQAERALLLQQQQQKGNGNDADNTESGFTNESTTTQPSRQSLRCQNRIEKLRLSADENSQNVSDGATPSVNIDSSGISSSSNDGVAATDTAKQQHKRRFELFFAAGGLRILNQWLLDASSYDTRKTSTPSSTTASKSSTPKSGSSLREKNNSTTNSTGGTATAQMIIRKAHATRPIALSILLFLEHIPFEKKTVTNSKINKQIQKLGKKVTSIKEAHQNGQAPNEDLENWTTKQSIAPDEALTGILVAVDAVKASWREKAKTKGDKMQQPNPFGALQSKMKDRLQILTQVETGARSTRPEWYRPPLTALAFKKKKSLPMKRKAALNEAEIEKLNLQKKIKQVQSRSQRSLQQLREKLRRRKVDHSNHTYSSSAAPNSVSSFSSNKRVVWKDGLSSEVARNRQMLEDVFVFGKDLPPSAGGLEDDLLLLSDESAPTENR
jgi:hypothetical protein